MGWIGAFEFKEMIGEAMQPASDEITTIRRPGISGDIDRHEPEKPHLFEKLTTELYTYKYNALDAAANYTALKGNLVTVIDDLDLTVYNVRVMDVQNVRVQRVLSSSEENVNYIVRARWILKPTL